MGIWEGVCKDKILRVLTASSIEQSVTGLNGIVDNIGTDGVINLP